MVQVGLLLLYDIGVILSTLIYNKTASVYFQHYVKYVTRYCSNVVCVIEACESRQVGA